MNLELGRSANNPDIGTGDTSEETPRWRASAHLEEILAHDNSAARNFARIARLSIVQQAIDRAEKLPDDELSAAFAEGLWQSYADLGDAVPKTVADLDARSRMAESAHGTTGAARDYMMQRLGAIAGIADLAAAMTLPPALIESLQRESDRLAVLLVAFDRAEHSHAVAAAAK